MIAERALGHAVDIEDTYDQHDFQDQIAEALRKLERMILSIVTSPPSNVIPLSQVR